MLKNRSRLITIVMTGVLALSTAGIGLVSTAQAATKHKAKTYNVAYLSYGVANSYDAPMLAAAKAVALTTGHVNVTVFDSQSTDTIQESQLQDVVNSKKYQGIIVQPIYGQVLIPEIKVAIKKGIKVVNIDQILGTNYASDQIEVKVSRATSCSSHQRLVHSWRRRRFWRALVRIPARSLSCTTT